MPETRKGSLQAEPDLRDEILALKVEMKKQIAAMKMELIDVLKDTVTDTIKAEMEIINKKIIEQGKEIQELKAGQAMTEIACSRLESEMQYFRSGEGTNFSVLPMRSISAYLVDKVLLFQDCQNQAMRILKKESLWI